MKTHTLLCAVGVLAITSTSAIAEGKLDAFKTLSGSEVSFSPPSDYFNAMLTISGPNGFFVRSFSKSGTAAVDLIRAGATTEGYYTYEITAATRETTDSKNLRLILSGDVAHSVRNTGAKTSGSFYAAGGLIVSKSD